MPQATPGGHADVDQHPDQPEGLNPVEVVVSWDAVPEATHHRIGYVNMESDYPLAKASVTGDWIEAFLYADVDARNCTVSGGRVQQPCAGWNRAAGMR